MDKARDSLKGYCSKGIYFILMKVNPSVFLNQLDQLQEEDVSIGDKAKKKKTPLQVN